MSWKLKILNNYAKFIELASEINGNMPHFVVSKIVDALNAQQKSVKGSRVFVLGVAYKKDIADTRESPALDVMKLLQDRGAKLSYHDPFVSKISLEPGVLMSSALDDELLEASDCVAIITDHSAFDYSRIVDKARVVVDTRNATRTVTLGREKITKI